MRWIGEAELLVVRLTLFVLLTFGAIQIVAVALSDLIRVLGRLL